MVDEIFPIEESSGSQSKKRIQQMQEYLQSVVVSPWSDLGLVSKCKEIFLNIGFAAATIESTKREIAEKRERLPRDIQWAQKVLLHKLFEGRNFLKRALVIIHPS